MYLVVHIIHYVLYCMYFVVKCKDVCLLCVWVGFQLDSLYLHISLNKISYFIQHTNSKTYSVLTMCTVLINKVNIKKILTISSITDSKLDLLF
jgi:hypothetical protein